MKTTLTKQAETLKEKINDVSHKSKVAIDTAIDLNSKHIKSAINAHKDGFESLNNLLYERKIDRAVVNSFQSILTKEVQLTEEIVNSVIDSFTRRIKMNIDFAVKVLDLVNSEKLYTKAGRDQFVELIRENFSQTSDYSMATLEKVVSFFDSQLHDELNLNRKLAESISSQITNIFEAQNKSMKSLFEYSEMINPWWAVEGTVKSN